MPFFAISHFRWYAVNNSLLLRQFDDCAIYNKPAVVHTTKFNNFHFMSRSHISLFLFCLLLLLSYLIYYEHRKYLMTEDIHWSIKLKWDFNKIHALLIYQNKAIIFNAHLFRNHFFFCRICKILYSFFYRYRKTTIYLNI